jgi:hypothetical protein
MINVPDPATFQQLRDGVRDLLNEFDAADGLASYYALHHDPRRTSLYLHRDPTGMVDGFLVCCQTGFDLFRPLVTLRLRGQGALPELIEQGLTAGRPYLAVVPAGLVERLEPYLAFNQPSRNLILRLDPSRFRPEPNVLVTHRQAPDGNPRAEIRRGKEVAAVAGVNWRSPLFAEIYVQVNIERRRQGWGRSVAMALCAELLRLGVTPLYSVAEDNYASRDLAEQIGFVDTGAREVVAEVVRL